MSGDGTPSRRQGGSHRARPGVSSYLLPGLVVALSVLAVVIGVIGWLGPGPGESAAPTPRPTVPVPRPTPTPTPVSPTPTPTPTPTVTPSVPPSASPSASPTPTTMPTATATPSATVLPVVRARVVVLNQTRQTGLAARVATQLRRAGWTVTGVGNWYGTVPTTTVYYPTGKEAAARSLARELGVDRIRPRVKGMLTDRLTVVLTADPYA